MVQQQLNVFLASVEKRAFRRARFAVGNDADALDIVQDAMMKLVERYSNKAAEEWPPLFHRILQNRIMDFHRSETRKWKFWKSANEDDFHGEEELVEDIEGPIEHLTAECTGAEIMAEIEKLPLRQQQCFLLRAWEGLSVEETAVAMELSTGSVKTHYSRAMSRLHQLLESNNE